MKFILESTKEVLILVISSSIFLGFIALITKVCIAVFNSIGLI